MSLTWDDMGAGASSPNAPDALAFAGNYLHCGQPMGRAGAEMRRISTTHEDKDRPDALAVYLATRVLRCRCGFQMEIPDPSQEPAG